MCALDKSHETLTTFLNTREVNSKLDYDTLDIGTVDITASPERERERCRIWLLYVIFKRNDGCLGTF